VDAQGVLVDDLPEQGLVRVLRIHLVVGGCVRERTLLSAVELAITDAVARNDACKPLQKPGGEWLRAVDCRGFAGEVVDRLPVRFPKSRHGTSKIRQKAHSNALADAIGSLFALSRREEVNRMKYEKQLRIREELDASFPRKRDDLGQQMFRSAYYIGRMADESIEEATASSIQAVRAFVPDFKPITA
jgi:hypothetical protein